MKKSIYNWGVVPCLIPDWSLVKAFGKKRISKEDYSTAYLSGLQERWDHVTMRLASLKPEADFTLLCHRHGGEFCHRWLVAELERQNRLDIEVNLL